MLAFVLGIVVVFVILELFFWGSYKWAIVLLILVGIQFLGCAALAPRKPIVIKTVFLLSNQYTPTPNYYGKLSFIMVDSEDLIVICKDDALWGHFIFRRFPPFQRPTTIVIPPYLSKCEIIEGEVETVTAYERPI